MLPMVPVGNEELTAGVDVLVVVVVVVVLEVLVVPLAF